MERVFCVVPIYKVEQYLKRCVESLVAQTYRNTYIILVDDGSPDNCPAMCDEFAEKYENIEVIHKQNGGLSDARNVGLKRCFELGEKEDYITLIDSDDFLRENYVEALISICQENDCQIAQCEYEKGSADVFSSDREKKYLEVTDKNTALLGYQLKTQVGPKLYKLELFRGENFPIGRLNEDEFFTYRIVYKCRKIAFTKEKLYYYYQRQESIMGEIAKNLKNSKHKYDWMYAYLERAVFFEERNEKDQVLRTYEKMCTDIILRHVEQLRLEKNDRDVAVNEGQYVRTYKFFYKKMIKRSGIPLKRKWMYRAFYIFPYSASIAAKFRPLRK